MIATALTLCLAACQKPIDVGIPAPPPDRLQCAGLVQPPRIVGLVPFQSGGENYVYDKRQVDERDAVIARFILDGRDAHFDCINAMAWLRDYYSAQAD